MACYHTATNRYWNLIVIKILQTSSQCLFCEHALDIGYKTVHEYSKCYFWNNSHIPKDRWINWIVYKESMTNQLSSWLHYMLFIEIARQINELMKNNKNEMFACHSSKLHLAWYKAYDISKALGYEPICSSLPGNYFIYTYCCLSENMG